MSTVQKWLAGLTGLGALYLVFSSPTKIADIGTGIKNATAGPIVAITTGGKGTAK